MLPVQKSKGAKFLWPCSSLSFRAFYGGGRSLQFFSIFSKIKIDLNKKISPRLLTMCHIFPISRGLQKNSLLTVLSADGNILHVVILLNI